MGQIRTSRRHTIEAVLLSFIWLITLLSMHDIPAPGTQNDIAWGAGYAYDIATGTSVFAVRDPYLRYVPQVILLELSSLFVPVTRTLALQVYAAYTAFVAGFASPLLAYLYARTHHGRRTGLVSLVLIAGVGVRDWFSVVPKIPTFVLTRIPNDTAWMAVSESLFGTPYVGGVTFHYAFAVPIVLGALLLYSAYRDSGERLYAVLTGVCIGIAGSIQPIQGLIGAAVVAGHTLRKRALHELVVVGAPAVLIALPNLLVTARFGDRWASQGGSRISVAPVNLALLAIALVLLAVGTVAVYRYTRVRDRVSVTLDPVLLSWLCVLLLLFYAFTPLAGNWYRWLVAGILKYGVIIAAATWLTPHLEELATSS